jgi:hypothetical protein
LQSLVLQDLVDALALILRGDQRDRRLSAGGSCAPGERGSIPVLTLDTAD